MGQEYHTIAISHRKGERRFLPGKWKHTASSILKKWLPPNRSIGNVSMVAMDTSVLLLVLHTLLIQKLSAKLLIPTIEEFSSGKEKSLKICVSFVRKWKELSF